MKKVNLLILVTRVCMRKPFFILRKQAKLMGNYFIIPKRNLDHLCPAVYAMTKMADLKKFRQSEGMFMDSTILASFSQIHQNEISLADQTILTNFRHFRYCMYFQTYLI